MSSSKSHIQCLAAVLLLSACLFEQASALNCYSCDSDTNVNCIYNPSQFGVTCQQYANNMNSSASNNQDAIQQNCATAVGIDTRDGHFRVVRGCAVQAVTCDTYKIIYAVNYNLQLDKCLRCGYNLCNSATF